MNATERARRSDALYYSNGPKRELCDKVAFLESDLEDAKAENDRLCRQLADATESMGRVEERCAKLRELAHWMYDLMDESCAVQQPYAPAPISYEQLMQVLAWARELGVEVD